MKKRINQLIAVITNQFPPALLVLAGVMKEWLPWILGIFFAVIGVIVWWKYRNRRWGVVLVTIAAFCGAIGIYMNNHKMSLSEEVQQAHDPLRSFVILDNEAEKAWESNDVALLEAVATYAFYRNMDKKTSNSFKYFDNIWRKLEKAKRAGSPSACFNMAIMCAGGYGRPTSIDDAVDNLQKAINLDSNFVPAYLMLEDLKIDSLKYAETYSLVKNWRTERNKRDSIAIDAFSELDELFGGADFSKIEKSKQDSFLNSCSNGRFQSFNDIFNKNTESKYWKTIHENRWALREDAAKGHLSYATLLLAAYYHGINETDSALFYYEKFLSSGIISRLHTNILSFGYTFIPDTIIDIYTRDVQPLLMGLSYIDLQYLGLGSKIIKSRMMAVPYNSTLAEVALCAMNLKSNRTLIDVEDLNSYKSKFNEITLDFADNIKKVASTRTEVIGKIKSPKYNLNIIVDIYNGYERRTNLQTRKYVNTHKEGDTYLIYGGEKDDNYQSLKMIDVYNNTLNEAQLRLQKYFKRDKIYAKTPTP